MPTRAIIQPVGSTGRYLHHDGNPDKVLHTLDQAVARHGYDGMVERLLEHDWSVLLDEPTPGGDKAGGYSVNDAPDIYAVYAYLLWPPRAQRVDAGPDKSDVDVYVSGTDGRIHRLDFQHPWPERERALCEPIHTGEAEVGQCHRQAEWRLHYETDEHRDRNGMCTPVQMRVCNVHATEEVEVLLGGDPSVVVFSIGLDRVEL